MLKNRLFTPGPTPVPSSVKLAMANDTIHHRHPEFQDVFNSCQAGLKKLFQTKQAIQVISGSGTASMEAIVQNFTQQSDVLVVNAGKFGHRWQLLNEQAGNQVTSIQLDWGQSVTVDAVIEVLKNKQNIDLVFLTHSETSTGAATDIKAIVTAVKNHNKNILVCVDGITAIGAMEFKFDEWNIDLVCTGSQKGLMMPPGLSFVAVSELAWKSYKDNGQNYLDLKKINANVEKNATPYTPAVTLMIGLQEALRLIHLEGLDNVWARHRKLSSALRAGINAIGLEVFASHPSQALTAVKIPELIDGQSFVSTFKQLTGMTLANGQDDYKGKIFRISHLGYYDEFDMISVLAGLEKVLLSFQYKFDLGSGLKALEQELWSN